MDICVSLFSIFGNQSAGILESVSPTGDRGPVEDEVGHNGCAVDRHNPENQRARIADAGGEAGAAGAQRAQREGGDEVELHLRELELWLRGFTNWNKPLQARLCFCIASTGVTPTSKRSDGRNRAPGRRRTRASWRTGHRSTASSAQTARTLPGSAGRRRSRSRRTGMGCC